MDDILLAYFDKKILQQIFLETQKILEFCGLIITADKVQNLPRWSEVIELVSSYWIEFCK